MDQILENALKVKQAMDDMIYPPEANTEDGRIPNSWLSEDGVRHAVIWDEDIPVRYKFKDGQLIETSVF